MALGDGNRYWFWRRDGWRDPWEREREPPMVLEIPEKGVVPVTECSDEDLRAFAEQHATAPSGGFSADWWERTALDLRDRERRRLKRGTP